MHPTQRPGTEMADTDPDLTSPTATATFAVTALHLDPTLFALGPVRWHALTTDSGGCSTELRAAGRDHRA